MVKKLKDSAPKYGNNTTPDFGPTLQNHPKASINDINSIIKKERQTKDIGPNNVPSNLGNLSLVDM